MKLQFNVIYLTPSEFNWRLDQHYKLKVFGKDLFNALTIHQFFAHIYFSYLIKRFHANVMALTFVSLSMYYVL